MDDGRIEMFLSFLCAIASGPRQPRDEVGVLLSHGLVQYVPTIPKDCWFLKNKKSVCVGGDGGGGGGWHLEAHSIELRLET